MALIDKVFGNTWECSEECGVIDIADVFKFFYESPSKKVPGVVPTRLPFNEVWFSLDGYVIENGSSFGLYAQQGVVTEDNMQGLSVKEFLGRPCIYVTVFQEYKGSFAGILCI